MVLYYRLWQLNGSLKKIVLNLRSRKCPKEIFKHSRRNKKFLNLALKAAAASDCNHKHGCVVTKGGRVMAIGINKWRNEMLSIEEDKRNQVLSVCAEYDALSRVDDARGAIVYIARAAKSGPANSRPCSRCQKLLIERGVKAVIYT